MAKGSASSSAPKPDPRIGDAAVKQAQLADDWLKFSKDQFAVSTQRQGELDALTKQVTQQQLDAGNLSLANAQADRARYDTVFRSIEDKYVADATDYASPERQAQAAASAGADVQNQAAVARGAARRAEAAVGIRPDSGRYAGIERSTDLGTSLGVAGAENAARQNLRDKGLDLEGQVVNLGKGLPIQATSETSLGLNAGASAAGLAQGNQDLSNRAVGIVGNGYSGASSGYGSEANTLANLYSQNLQQWTAQQQLDSQNQNGLLSGLGSAAGIVFGGASAPWWLSSKKLKTDKAPLKDGEALKQVKAMPVESWRYKDGVDAPAGQHVGPYAEDFQKTTGTGDGKTIAVQDAVGITMRAVQDLAKDVDRLAAASGVRRAAPRRAAPAPMKRAA